MPEAPRGARRAPGPFVAAVLGGAAWGLCFGEQPHPLLASVALVPLLHLAHRRRLAAAFTYGMVSWLVAIPWIARTVRVYGDMSPPFDIVALVALAGYLALYPTLFAWLIRRPLDGRSPTLALLAVPAFWCVTEWGRGVVLTGFPWSLAGYSWVDVPGALAWSSWSGALGVGFLLVLCNSAIYQGLFLRRWTLALAALLGVLLALSQAERWARPAETAADRVPLRIVQPATPIHTDSSDPGVVAGYNELFRLSREACDERGALLVWPESAAWPWALERDPQFRAQVEALALAGCPVLLNSPRWQGEEVFNSAFLVRGPNQAEHSDKRHLVPFGEYVPLPGWLPFPDGLARNIGDFSAADRATPLALGDHRLGVAICFEITFAREVVDHVTAGADILATITNDAWYGDTAAPHQHLRAARFRAAENDRPVVRAALTGISALIESDGSPSAILGVGERGILRGFARPRTTRTLFSRAPWLTLALSVVLGASATIVAAAGGATVPSRNP